MNKVPQATALLMATSLMCAQAGRRIVWSCIEKSKRLSEVGNQPVAENGHPADSRFNPHSPPPSILPDASTEICVAIIGPDISFPQPSRRDCAALTLEHLQQQGHQSEAIVQCYDFGTNRVYLRRPVARLTCDIRKLEGQ